MKATKFNIPRVWPIRVYIAGPISGGNAYMNCIAGIQVAEKLRLLGYIPFCPHLSYWWHQVTGCKTTHKEWLSYDLRWLELCDVVLRIPGESTGADMEVQYAKELGMPVLYSIDELTAAYPVKKKRKTKKLVNNSHFWEE